MNINQGVENAKAKAVDWGFSESREKNTPYFWIKFLFLELESDTGEELTITHQLYLTENNFKNVIRQLRKFRWLGDSIFDFDKDNPSSFDLSKKEIYLTIVMTEYNNKFYPKVKFINEFPYGNGDKKLDTEKLKNIDQKLKEKLKNIDEDENIFFNQGDF